MTIGSESGEVHLTSPKRIKLQTSGGASLTIDSSGVKLVCPGNIKVRAVKKCLVGGGRVLAPVLGLPSSELTDYSQKINYEFLKDINEELETDNRIIKQLFVIDDKTENVIKQSYLTQLDKDTSERFYTETPKNVTALLFLDELVDIEEKLREDEYGEEDSLNGIEPDYAEGLYIDEDTLKLHNENDEENDA
jgi:hypothetical protein